MPNISSFIASTYFSIRK